MCLQRLERVTCDSLTEGPGGCHDQADADAADPAPGAVAALALTGHECDREHESEQTQRQASAVTESHRGQQIA